MVNLFGLLLFSLYFASSLGQLPSPDILALLQFKKGIKHDPTGYVLNSWSEESIDFNGCPSSWNGIVCNADHVAGVVLDNLSLSGEADLRVFVNLTMLVKLSLANNSISGVIPDDIGSFNKLQYLDLSNNLFSSSLPSELGNLGTLQNLSLAGNNFSGVIPSSLRKLKSLVYLKMSRNRLTEKIPKGFELLSSLEVLDLHGNLLDGDLDEEFLQFTSANYVDLSDNQLGHPGSQQQKFLPRVSESIKHLNLSHNRLNGSLPGQTQLFDNLKVLDLSFNQLSGDLPEFNFVYDLEVLRLSNNNFSGFVPNDLLKGDPVLLTELDLSGNNLTGAITMITSTTLRVLNLSSNALSGELPLLTGDLAILDLSNNQFEGNLTKMVKWGNVELLDLSRNHLDGPIPEIKSQFLHLNYMNLSHNALTGSLPKIVTQFPKLSILDLSFNQLNGPLEPNLLTMPTLEELYLTGNSFVGNVKFSPSYKSNLRVLDLSQNHLDGYFPDQLGSLTDLQVLNLAANNLSGSLPTSINNMTSLTSLDISQNHFTGSLPNNLSTTTLQSFNASYNDLSGVVPEKLRKFPRSSFYPGNSRLKLPNAQTSHGENENGNSYFRRSEKTLIKVIIIVACVLGFFILLLVVVFVYYILMSRKSLSDNVPKNDVETRAPPNPHSLVISAEDIIMSSDEKLDATSLDRLEGELCFLDDTLSLTPEELCRAPAEVLGRSSHGTSYKATLENGVFLTVKWLREGVAKPRKEFAKEARKFANIRHPNVVALRGYYWGPTQQEKLILWEYVSPGSLSSFLYDRPGRSGQALTWDQRLKIAVDIARGLNYLHFDRALPHGNLKSNNVLLHGPELHARVSDYCLHRLMTEAGTTEQILDAGVLGYRAPELAASKKPAPSFKADVYAFGVILLELLTGKCAGEVSPGVGLTEWIRVKVAEGSGSGWFDSVLGVEMSDPSVLRGTDGVLGVALRCIRPVSERPGIKTVYEDLSSI